MNVPDASGPGAFGRPRVGVSSCLLGEAVRFNGGHKRSRFGQTCLAPFPAGRTLAAPGAARTTR